MKLIPFAIRLKKNRFQYICFSLIGLDWVFLHLVAIFILIAMKNWALALQLDKQKKAPNDRLACNYVLESIGFICLFVDFFSFPQRFFYAISPHTASHPIWQNESVEKNNNRKSYMRRSQRTLFYTLGVVIIIEQKKSRLLIELLLLSMLSDGFFFSAYFHLISSWMRFKFKNRCEANGLNAPILKRHKQGDTEPQKKHHFDVLWSNNNVQKHDINYGKRNIRRKRGINPRQNIMPCTWFKRELFVEKQESSYLDQRQCFPYTKSLCSSPMKYCMW